MTPKEKAFEIFWEYIYEVVAKPEKAKKCALIAVDEILEICSLDCLTNLNNHEFEAKFNYWNEVKQEIEKL